MNLQLRKMNNVSEFSVAYFRSIVSEQRTKININKNGC